MLWQLPQWPRMPGSSNGFDIPSQDLCSCSRDLQPKRQGWHRWCSVYPPVAWFHLWHGGHLQKVMLHCGAPHLTAGGALCLLNFLPTCYTPLLPTGGTLCLLGFPPACWTLCLPLGLPVCLLNGLFAHWTPHLPNEGALCLSASFYPSFVLVWLPMGYFGCP